jgi:type I restriction enzyme M protein
MERIAEEAFNLNISRYISTAEQEAEIDLTATHGDLVEIEKQIRSATAKHNAFLKDLGLPLLPEHG